MGYFTAGFCIGMRGGTRRDNNILLTATGFFCILIVMSKDGKEMIFFSRLRWAFSGLEMKRGRRQENVGWAYSDGLLVNIGMRDNGWLTATSFATGFWIGDEDKTSTIRLCKSNYLLPGKAMIDIDSAQAHASCYVRSRRQDESGSENDSRHAQIHESPMWSSFISWLQGAGTGSRRVSTLGIEVHDINAVRGWTAGCRRPRKWRGQMGRIGENETGAGHSSMQPHGAYMWVARAGTEKQRRSSTSRYEGQIVAYTRMTPAAYGRRGLPLTQRPNRIGSLTGTMHSCNGCARGPNPSTTHDAQLANSVRVALMHTSAPRIRVALRRTTSGAHSGEEPEGRVRTGEREH
ncbi:hypothetical protein B0H17DRAFT_1150959 [Mycena rosella]|uniref:Uncharacterized protein n=1 Tax=Mycena rosella TaxID=1033263 RepID=A0AAD7BNZ8_MYCRO|nr:hypothetical protein B0H17DRAFT_1150959 [Mycena rosella]